MSGRSDRSHDRGSSVTIEGGLLPWPLLAAVFAHGRKEADELGLDPQRDYDLPPGWTIADAANRAWDALQGRWLKLMDIPEGDRTGAVLRKEWLLPLFYELQFGTLSIERGSVKFDDRTLKVSSFWPSRDEIHVPIHLADWDVDLDFQTGKGVSGARPHGIVQDYLNRAPKALWGILTNGTRLRLLRDSSALTGSAYLEFDLEAIFAGSQNSEFQLLFRMLHVSRFAVMQAEPDSAEDSADGEGDSEETGLFKDAGAAEDGDVEESAPDLDAVRAATPEDCWLEKWRVYAVNAGAQAREKMREGVSEALVTLGNGFLNTPGEANAELQRRLDAPGGLDREDFHHALLRVVYRILFLFVVEDRDALLLPFDPQDSDARKARERYRDYYSTRHLRELAERSVGSGHTDRWHGLRLVFKGLAGREDLTGLLGLPQLGGIFEHLEDLDFFDECNLANVDLFGAVRQLAWFDDGGRRTKVDYRNLGSDELGSVFESLLEEIPFVDSRLGLSSFKLVRTAGNERKTSGSFYTPTILIEQLLKTALDPVLEEAEARARREKNPDHLLTVTICDPACGSGHFLTAAARRIAGRLARLRGNGVDEATPEKFRAALHEVVAHCVFGIDIKPLAVELAKFALWMEAIEPGRPLPFLDAQIKVGNGLLGATPALLNKGIPQEAFKALEGDDPKYTSDLKAENKKEQRNVKAARQVGWNSRSMVDHTVPSLFDASETILAGGFTLATDVREVLERTPRNLRDIAAQKQRYSEFLASPVFLREKAIADTWCAAFVQRKELGRPAITNGGYFRLKSESVALSPELERHVHELGAEYRFFHWHLEFPQIFNVDAERMPGESGDDVGGWRGGFSCIIGNPPWERVKLEAKEYFASRVPEIANAGNKAERDMMIDALQDTEPGVLIHREYLKAKRKADGEGHLARASGRFPLTATGDINTYPLFTETARLCIQPGGRFGLVVQTGIATDKTTSAFFSDLVQRKALVSFYDFANERFILSRAVHHSMRFCLLTGSGREAPIELSRFAFDCWLMSDLDERSFTMTREQITKVNPNTGTLPIFRTRRDAEITLGIYDRVPVLLKEAKRDARGNVLEAEVNPWGVSFTAMFHMSGDSHLFLRRDELRADGWALHGNAFSKKVGSEELRYLPLYEAKMLHHYDHRFGTYDGQTVNQAAVGTLPRATPEQHDDPDYVVTPRYWVPEFDVPDPEKVDDLGRPILNLGVASRLRGKRWSSGWMLGWRDVARRSDSRTFLASVMPALGAGHKFLLAGPRGVHGELQASWSSSVFDFVARQKIGGSTMAYFTVYQLPVHRPEKFEEPAGWDAGEMLGNWISSRVLELAYTANDMVGFARSLGDDGEPFRWEEERREVLRAELDAAFFHLYGVSRDDTAYIMDTFTAIAKRDVKFHGSYRTKDLILSIYDAMRSAIDTGTPYRTRLDPPPGQGERHGPRKG